MYTKKYRYLLKPKDIVIPGKWELIRSVGKGSLSAKAQLKLEWIIFYHTVGKRNALKTAAHFGINPKTLHKWKGRFDEKDVTTLEEESRAPDNVRKKEISRIPELRIIKLRRAHLR